MSESDILFVGSRLAPEVRQVFQNTGTSGAISLPHQTITMVLGDYRPSDKTIFEAPARFRVALCKSFLLISPSFPEFNFDIIWSPLIARLNGEPTLERPSPTDHAVFNFILADGVHVVRAIRTSSISPACSLAMWRAQQTLMAASFTGDELKQEMNALFSQYQRGIPEMFFNETCALGD